MCECTLPSESRPMKWRAPALRAASAMALCQVSPSNSAPRGDGLVHQRGALVVDAAAAEGVVADLAVAHVVVAGQADRGAVGAQRRRAAPGAHSASSVGVAASLTASASSPWPTPTPSRTTSTGPLGPLKRRVLVRSSPCRRQQLSMRTWTARCRCPGTVCCSCAAW